MAWLLSSLIIGSLSAGYLSSYKAFAIRIYRTVYLYTGKDLECCRMLIASWGKDQLYHSLIAANV
jgi:hypothetical protein